MRISFAILMVFTASLFIVSGAEASLMPVSFGFPTIAQMVNSLAWSQDTANALSYEDISIDFGGGVPFGPGVSLAFPSIHQTSLECQSMTHTDFAQTSEYAAFAFPFAGIGSPGIPALGFI